MKRKIWLDYAKVLGIYAVILGHYHNPASFTGRIYAFHMPLFFFLSGYLFSFKKDQNYTDFIKKLSTKIIIPYFFFSIITYIYWLLIVRHFGSDANDHVPFYTPLIGIFYGLDKGHFMDHDVPLWFLTCLFITENLFFILFRNIVSPRLKILTIAIFALLGYINYSYNPYRLPWNIDVALVAMVFFAAGNYVKEFFSKELFMNLYLNLFLVGILGVLFYYLSAYDLTVTFSRNKYGNYLYMLLNASIGIACFISLCKLLEKIFQRNKLFEFISVNTLIIFALQSSVMGFIKAFYHLILKLPSDFFNNKIGFNALFSIMVIIILLPIIYLMNRYIPFLIGKGKRQTNTVNLASEKIAN